MHNARHSYEIQMFMIASFTAVALCFVVITNNCYRSTSFFIEYKKRACIDIWCLIYLAPLRNICLFKSLAIKFIDKLSLAAETNCCIKKKPHFRATTSGAGSQNSCWYAHHLKDSVWGHNDEFLMQLLNNFHAEMQFENRNYLYGILASSLMKQNFLMDWYGSVLEFEFYQIKFS